MLLVCDYCLLFLSFLFEPSDLSKVLRKSLSISLDQGFWIKPESVSLPNGTSTPTFTYRALSRE